MPKKYVHPEGAEAFPTTKEDEEALKAIGFQPEEEPKAEEPAPAKKKGKK